MKPTPPKRLTSYGTYVKFTCFNFNQIQVYGLLLDNKFPINLILKLS